MTRNCHLAIALVISSLLFNVCFNITCVVVNQTEHYITSNHPPQKIDKNRFEGNGVSPLRRGSTISPLCVKRAYCILLLFKGNGIAVAVLIKF